MYKIGEDEMVFCPYNRYHIVSKLRIQKHIIKCKKNYPDVKLATCFYNYTHRLKPEDMLEHYEICSQKTRIEGSRYSEPFRLTSSNSSVKNESFNEEFPDINVKPRFFSGPDTVSSSSSSTLGKAEESDSSSFESEIDHPQIEDDNVSDDNSEPLPLPKTVSKAFVFEKQKSNSSRTQIEDDDNVSDNLQPLPLPKIVSKAFVFEKQKSNSSRTQIEDNDNVSDNLQPLPLPKTVSQAFVHLKKPENLGSDISQPKRFGRGKNFCPLTSTKKSTRTSGHSPNSSTEVPK